MSKNHHQLSTFGIVDRYTPAQIRQIIAELESLGLLSIAVDDYNSVRLTPGSLKVLKGNQKVLLSELFLPGKATSRLAKSRLRITSPAKEPNVMIDQPLFEKLRDLRTKIAKKAGMPPYIIFTDQSLQEIAAQKPTNMDEFGHIYGVGEQKLVKYGQVFVELVQQHGEG